MSSSMPFSFCAIYLTISVLQMLRRKAEKRIVELSPDEARLLREALLAFRNKLLSAGKPTEDVNELIIKVMK